MKKINLQRKKNIKIKNIFKPNNIYYTLMIIWRMKQDIYMNNIVRPW